SRGQRRTARRDPSFVRSPEPRGIPPELVGSVTFVWEDDGTPDNAIRNLFDDVVAVAKTDLAGLFEHLTVADLADPDRLSDQVADTIADIKDQVVPQLLGKIKLFIQSLGDVDDRVGGAIDPSAGVGGTLRPRSYRQRFTGGGASYEL